MVFICFLSLLKDWSYVLSVPVFIRVCVCGRLVKNVIENFLRGTAWPK